MGNHELAYQAFHHAYKHEKSVEMIPRELAGVCLELRRFDEAVKVAEQAVVLDPRNAELIGNLSLAYLMARRYEEARKSIDTAIRIAPGDNINQTVARILCEIVEGRRAAPESLADLSKPAKAETGVVCDNLPPDLQKRADEQEAKTKSFLEAPQAARGTRSSPKKPWWKFWG